MLVESGHWRRDGELLNLLLFGVLNNFFVQLANVANGDGFGFVGHGKFEQESVGWKLTFVALVDEIRVEVCVIILYGVLDNRVFWLVALNDDVTILVAAFGATDDLSDELVAALFG